MGYLGRKLTGNRISVGKINWIRDIWNMFSGISRWKFSVFKIEIYEIRDS